MGYFGSLGKIDFLSAKPVVARSWCNAENCKVQLKVGINRWMDILLVNMQRDPALHSADGSDWWSVDLCFDEVSIYTLKLLYISDRYSKEDMT